MKRKAISIMLALVLCLSLLPVTAWAAETAHNHDEITFEAWNGTTTLLDTAGSWYLTDDVTLSETWSVPAGTVKLCLNGKVVRMSGTDSVITVPEGAALNLYDCDTETVNGGVVTGGSSSDNGGVTVSIPCEIPADRNAADYAVWYLREDGAAEEQDSVYDRSRAVFKVGHFSDYVLTYEEDAVSYVNCPKDETCVIEPFTDTANDAWWHDGIHHCVEEGIMNGMTDTQIDPNGTITRGMIVTMLWRLDGERYVNYAMRFADVPAEQWYTEAIRWAASEKIVKGYDETRFGPDEPVTREQLATILYGYAKYKGQGFVGSWMFLLDFTDRADISAWADEAVHWCSMKGIVNGRDGKVFDPQGYATRAEAAAMMQRLSEVLGR